MSTYDFLGLSGGPFATAYALRVFTCIVTSARNGSYSKHALFHCVLIFLLLIYNIISHILIIAGNEGFFFFFLHRTAQPRRGHLHRLRQGDTRGNFILLATVC